MPFKKKKILAGITFYLPPIDTGKQSLIAASGRAPYDAAVKKILIFEDDEQASVLLEESFRAAGGFKVMTHHSSSRPIEKLRQFKPDAVILELKISPVSGWDVIKMIRHDRVYSKIAVILVSGHYKSVSDISAGLEDFCADGYVLKPFSPRVMVSLVKSILRRSLPDAGNPQGRFPGYDSAVRVGKLLIKPDGHEIFLGRFRITLTPLEFAVFLYLARNIGRVCPRSEILSSLNTRADETCTRAIDRHAASIRQKIKNTGVDIRSVYGRGYVIEESKSENK